MKIFATSALFAALGAGAMMFSMTPAVQAAPMPVMSQQGLEPARLVDQVKMKKRKKMTKMKMHGPRAGADPAGTKTNTDGMKRTGADK